MADIVSKLKVIYRPKGQAGEYAPLSANGYRGCSHGCKYCYVPAATYQSRVEFDADAVPRKGFIEKLVKDAKRLHDAGNNEQIMFSFSTDPYNPREPEHHVTRQSLIALRVYDRAFCTLTKGGTRALRDLELFRPTCDAFASTLTTLDDSVSREWEANAALPGDRLSALQQFHDAGIFTWVSLEPVLDPETTLRIIEVAAPFVDLFKVGQINYSKLTRLIDWRGFTLRAIDLLNKLGKQHYIKKDLQGYLPEGYPNPLRVPQHH